MAVDTAGLPAVVVVAGPTDPARFGPGPVPKLGRRPKPQRVPVRAELISMEARRPATPDRVERTPVIPAVRLVAAVPGRQAEVVAVLQVVMPGDRQGCGRSAPGITRSRRSMLCRTMAAATLVEGRRYGSGEGL